MQALVEMRIDLFALVPEQCQLREAFEIEFHPASLPPTMVPQGSFAGKGGVIAAQWRSFCVGLC
ncbi:hypothetical protein HYN69_02365 [Gemmobacter aquarius]|uniref:Uncharacterized protein n=1 Tax=Paragemmobacter aquarius TaxID=2169400 RepID=A0A2S0UI70_9RHOB|nr:hypothetical protein HYN69_02365 [Gemmobacter aquarius]